MRRPTKNRNKSINRRWKIEWQLWRRDSDKGRLTSRLSRTTKINISSSRPSRGPNVKSRRKISKNWPKKERLLLRSPSTTPLSSIRTRKERRSKARGKKKDSIWSKLLGSMPKMSRKNMLQESRPNLQKTKGINQKKNWRV